MFVIFRGFFQVNQLEKYRKWVYSDNRKHYYKKSTVNTNIWEEIEDDETTNVVDTFELKTYDSNSLVLYSSQTFQYLELSYDKAKLSFGEIENLDDINAEQVNRGYWDESEIDRNISSCLLNKYSFISLFIFRG